MPCITTDAPSKTCSPMRTSGAPEAKVFLHLLITPTILIIICCTELIELLFCFDASSIYGCVIVTSMIVIFISCS